MPLDPRLQADLGKVLAHRGPDDFQKKEGRNSQSLFWRLSIVDETGGKQPMSLPERGLTVLFNGEIYNFRQLRRDLQEQGFSFRTESDTEVILAVYDRWGAAGFRRFEGMFAFCLIDERQDRLLLVRDRLGVKPLYFSSQGDSLLVASEIKALLASQRVPSRLDRPSLSCYLLLQTVLGFRTLFQSVLKVPPATVITFSGDGKKILSVQPLSPASPVARDTSYEGYRQEVREAILGQVRLSLETDLPTCFHLSGGFDSNTLVALSRHFHPGRSRTLLSSFVEGDQDAEKGYIQQAAAEDGGELLTVDITPEIFFRSLPDVFYHLDEPVGDPGVVAQFLVNRLAAGRSRILFSGQGFDEMFFGYIRDLATYVHHQGGPEALRSDSEAFRKLPLPTQSFLDGWGGFLKDFQSGAESSWILFRKLCRFDPWGAGDLLKPLQEELQPLTLEIYRGLVERGDSLHHFMFLAETEIQLPSLLQMEDRASMSSSLETRVPFCTNRIYDLAVSARLEWKFFGGRPKGLLRDIFKDLLPEPIAGRNQKVGRPVPFRRWLNQKIGQESLQKIRGKKELFQDLLGCDFVGYALDTQEGYDRSAWAVLSLVQWMDIYKVAV